MKTGTFLVLLGAAVAPVLADDYDSTTTTTSTIAATHKHGKFDNTHSAERSASYASAASAFSVAAVNSAKTTTHSDGKFDNTHWQSTIKTSTTSTTSEKVKTEVVKVTESSTSTGAAASNVIPMGVAGAVVAALLM